MTRGRHPISKVLSAVGQCLGLACLLGLGTTQALGALLKEAQTRQLATELRQAKEAEQAREPVRAFLHLSEALRLEQLWSGNTLGNESPVSKEMERFSSDLVRRDDDQLMRILHSRVVPLTDKLSLISLLEEEVILNFPGIRGDTMLQGYDE